MTKEICTICYKKTATRINNLYCESCLDDLITEINSINPKKDKEEQNKPRTIESEYFNNNKYKK